MLILNVLKDILSGITHSTEPAKLRINLALLTTPFVRDDYNEYNTTSFKLGLDPIGSGGSMGKLDTFLGVLLAVSVGSGKVY